MSTLNFPTSPSLNDTYSFGTKTWIWNGAAWQLNSTGAINNIPVGNVTPSTGAFTTLAANSTISAVGNITGSYFIGNGSQLTGIASGGITWTTQANAAPSSPAPGDFWFDAYTGVKYQYTNDGTGNVWVDQSFPTSFSTLAVAGNATVGGTLAVTGNVTGNYFVGTATAAQYADLAEIYAADSDYAPGTVLVFGGTQEVTISNISHDTRIAGVVSTAPAYLMNSEKSGIAVALSPVCLVEYKDQWPKVINW